MSSIKYQTAVKNLRANYARIDAQRKDKQIKIIDFIDNKTTQTLPGKKVHVEAVFCRATTMSGKRCKFRAGCNGLCKKHKL